MKNQITVTITIIITTIIIQFFIMYVPIQQLQGQLQTQHSLDTGKSRYGQTQHKDNRQITGKHWREKTH
jgi:hypothetical protein